VKLHSSLQKQCQVDYEVFWALQMSSTFHSSRNMLEIHKLLPICHIKLKMPLQKRNQRKEILDRIIVKRKGVGD